MRFIEEMNLRAKKEPKRIILPEGEDERVIKASVAAHSQKIARPILVGEEEAIKKAADQSGLDLTGIQIIDHKTSPKKAEYAEAYYKIYKEKGKKISDEEIDKALADPLHFGALAVRTGDADGMVAGCINPTARTIKAAYRGIGLASGASYFSSFTVMILLNETYGEKGILIYADAGVNPDPNAEELAEIAVSTGKNAQHLLGIHPRIAMLSFSTKGSAEHPLVEKVAEATAIAKKKAPNLDIDGEMQADSALLESIAKKKMGASPVAGRANVLIFPDLNSANIAYKLTQYLAGASAYGPLLQGFAKPVNDLSRGASSEDILGVIAITVVEAQNEAG